MATTAPSSEDRKKALDDALASIEKSYGKGAIMRMGEAPQTVQSGVIPTGSLSLDIALGVGGVPRGRIVEIYGQESSGKTTLALHILASAQRQGGTVAIIDAEHALDPGYAASIGMDVDELIVSQPDFGEQALEIADALVRSGALSAVAVDSVAALVPRTEIEGEMGDAHVGLQARLMSQALRKLAGSVKRSNTCAIFINQVREKIGVMFGNPETTPGGRALKFWSSVRLEVRRAETLKRGEDAVGVRAKVRIVKNKVAPPFKKAEFDIVFGEGISYEGDLIDLGLEHKILTKSGTWFSYGDERLGQGRENARDFLKENTEIAEEIAGKIRQASGIEDLPEPEEADEPSEDDEQADEE
ncbi:MAG: recombinase RecA [Armatimonadia bacterium]|nr:recombinase RecA [Armatimonadia bacterium]